MISGARQLFKEAKQGRIFQDVVEQIQNAILRGDLKTGDMLPPERELKETFKTSRGTLREALRILEQKGLIEIKLGVSGGAVVKSAMVDQFADNLALIVRFQQIPLIHLAEFREGVEGAVAAIAALRAQKKDLDLLKSLLAEARIHVDGGAGQWDAFLSVDKKVHQALATITGNPMYIMVHQVVHDNIQRYYDQFLPADEKRLNENFQDLCDIVDAIGRGEATEARIFAQRHVRRFNGYMMEHEKG
ncbi:MAG: FadR family transcriptional regulator [Desulfobacterales bacterium]|nr:FadR family transcriptional regulator [Desulfobacterales bacterium]